MSIIQLSHEGDDFTERLRVSLLKRSLNIKRIRVSRNEDVYGYGDRAQMVYFIVSGRIKLHQVSPNGKECLLSILTAGDIFGELCLAGAGLRQEIATAMEETTLSGISRAMFFTHLGDGGLAEDFVRYLATRVAEQQQFIAHLTTVDSEHCLGETLLMLAQKLGRPTLHSKRIEQKITHEELSQMIGTTRPRVTEFMRNFRRRGLVALSIERVLLVNEQRLAEYLARPARGLISKKSNIEHPAG